jgi:16S rRNA (guanine(966)-N(2))-methyltransferase RsmD
MRIIAGTLKGRRLLSPSAGHVRPTSDRLRETLFNILREAPVDARVLDGFAGTGAIGLEAISRGARHVTFVERDRRVVAELAKNVAACHVENACTIERDNFLGFVSRHPHMTGFDLVLLDPPYDFDDLGAVLAEASALVAPDGQVVLEHSRRRGLPPPVPGLVHHRSVTAGDSALAFYRPLTGNQQA